MRRGPSMRRGGLAGYAASRLITSLLIALGAMAILFTLTLFVPGDPASTLLGPRATPEAIAAFRVRMGLDQPVLDRLVQFLWRSIQGDLGTDIISGRPIAALVGDALPHTIGLTLVAIGLSIAIGVPLGCHAATHPGGRFDRASAIASVSVIAVPSYVVAIFLLLVFALRLGWFPALGAGDGGVVDAARHLVLPAVALAAGWIGYIARLTRASLVDALGEPHIRTMRAFGLHERVVVYKYALKAGLSPVLAVLGLGVGKLLGGAVFVEVVFARPGLGKLLYEAIGTRNYPVVEGAVLVVVLLFVMTNLAVDLLHAWMDPRVRATLASPERGRAA